MARRRATVTEIGATWVAVVGATSHVYKTRHGAVNRLLDELDHWIRWARFFDHSTEERLQGIRSEIHRAQGSHEWRFDIAGMPATCALVAPK